MSLSPYIRIHQYLREFPRYNRFIQSAHGLKLSTVESHILVELSATPGLSQKEIVNLLGLEKSQISRIVAGLQKRALIKVTTGTSDAREKRLFLTGDGKRDLTSFDKAANLNLEAFDKLSALTNIEKSTLVNFIENLAEALESPQSSFRESEHPLRRSIRRLTRSFGLLATNVLGSNLSPLKWQTLLEVYESKDGLPVGVLAKTLGVSESTISDAIASMIRQKILRKRSSATDERSVIITTSPKGAALVEDVTNKQATLYRSRLKLSTSQAVQIEKVISRWVTAAAIHHHTTGRGFEVRKLKSDTDFQKARHLAVSNISPGDYLPPQNFDPTNNCTGIFHSEGLYAAIETIEERAHHRLINAAITDRQDLEPLRALCLATLGHKKLALEASASWLEPKQSSEIKISILGQAIKERLL